jgi:hypothetical protein
MPKQYSGDTGPQTGLGEAAYAEQERCRLMGPLLRSWRMISSVRYWRNRRADPVDHGGAGTSPRHQGAQCLGGPWKAPCAAPSTSGCSAIGDAEVGVPVKARTRQNGRGADQDLPAAISRPSPSATSTASPARSALSTLRVAPASTYARRAQLLSC